MTALYYGKVPIQSVTSDTAQAGFPAANLLLEALGRPWYGTNTAAQNVNLVRGGLGATAMLALMVHDVNWATAAIFKQDGVGVVTPAGALNTFSDRHGRRRGLLVVNGASVATLIIQLPAGATTDGLGYYRIGAAHVFTSKFALPVGPEYTYSTKTKRPRISQTLENGVTAIAKTGLNIDRMALTFQRKDVESFNTLIQQASAGTCAFDLELPNYPEGVWPVRCLDDEIEEAFTDPTFSTIQLNLTEVVASN